MFLLKELLDAIWGLHWRLSGKEPVCQCRRCGFDPWVRKIPWRRKWPPTPVFLPGKSHGQRNLTATVYRGCSGVPVAQTVKTLPVIQETRVQSLGWEVPLEKGMAVHFSILAWKIPWTEKPDRLQSMVLQRVGHD